MEALIYNLNSMHSRAGAQVPFSSINLGTDTSPEGRMITRALLLAHGRGLGRGETPIFPNIIFRVKKGVNLDPGDPNYDLFQLAIRTASRRLNPTFSFMDSTFNAPYGDEVSYMGCRTRVIASRHGPEISTGRGNLSFTTVDLPLGDPGQRGLRSYTTINSTGCWSWPPGSYHRFRLQSKLKVKDMPFLMGQGPLPGFGETGPDDPIAPVIKHGTLSVGFIGLSETLTLNRFPPRRDPAAHRLGLEIVSHMRRRIDEFCR